MMYEMYDQSLAIELFTAIVSIALFGAFLFLNDRRQKRLVADRQPTIFVAEPDCAAQPDMMPDKAVA